MGAENLISPSAILVCSKVQWGSWLLGGWDPLNEFHRTGAPESPKATARSSYPINGIAMAVLTKPILTAPDPCIFYHKTFKIRQFFLPKRGRNGIFSDFEDKKFRPGALPGPHALLYKRGGVSLLHQRGGVWPATHLSLSLLPPRPAKILLSCFAPTRTKLDAFPVEWADALDIDIFNVNKSWKVIIFRRFLNLSDHGYHLVGVVASVQRKGRRD